MPAAAAVTVVLTRSSEDNAPLRAALQARGVAVLEVPTVDVRAVGPEPDAATVDAWMGSARAVAFTSRNGVQSFAKLLGSSRLTAFARDGGLIAAVGKATAQVLVSEGIEGVLAVHEPMTGSHLAEALADRLEGGEGAVVAFQGRHARPELTDGLRQRGVEARVVVVYENAVPAAPAADLLRACAAAHAIFVAAPSAADRLLAWAPELRDRRFVAIGPTTAAELQARHGIQAATVASSPAAAAILGAIEQALGL